MLETQKSSQFVYLLWSSQREAALKEMPLVGQK